MAYFSKFNNKSESIKEKYATQNWIDVTKNINNKILEIISRSNVLNNDWYLFSIIE